MKTREKLLTKLKKQKPVKKAPDPLVTLIMPYGQAKIYRNALIKYLVGEGLNDNFPQVVWKHWPYGYEIISKFTHTLADQIGAKKKELENTPSKKISIEIRSTLIRTFHLALYSLLEQPNIKNGTRMLMKSYDPEAYKALQSLFKKV